MMRDYEDKIIRTRQWQNKFRGIISPRHRAPPYSVVCPHNDGKFYVKNADTGGYIYRLDPDGLKDVFHTHKNYVPPRTHARARAIAEMKNAERYPLLSTIHAMFCADSNQGYFA